MFCIRKTAVLKNSITFTKKNMARSIAIGDIHGCVKTFSKLLDEINLKKEDELVLLGDYIDRGAESKAVIDFIFSLLEAGYNIKCLRGNHEQLFMNATEVDDKYPRWLRSGGDATLQSFGCTFFQEIPDKYQTFFHDTLHYYETEKYIFVHAGLNFLNEDIFEDKTAMLWIRDFDAMQAKLGHKRLIHGHTPKSMTHIIKQRGNCFNIDGGCVYQNIEENLGYLVALILDTMQYKFVAYDE